MRFTSAWSCGRCSTLRLIRDQYFSRSIGTNLYPSQEQPLPLLPGLSKLLDSSCQRVSSGILGSLKQNQQTLVAQVIVRRHFYCMVQCLLSQSVLLPVYVNHAEICIRLNHRWVSLDRPLQVVHCLVQISIAHGHAPEKKLCSRPCLGVIGYRLKFLTGSV